MTSKKDHPFNKFGCGNLKSLGGTDGARMDLIDFHHKWYSSNTMALTVLSKHPIEKMAE